MLLRMTSSLDLKVKYLHPNGSGFRYKRRFPKEIAAYFHGATFFERPINTTNVKDAVKIAQGISRNFERLKDDIRKQEAYGIPAPQLIELLKQRIEHLGTAGECDFEPHDLLVETLMDRETALLDKLVGDGHSPAEAIEISKQVQLALPHELAYLNSSSKQPRKLSITQAASTYLENHAKRDTPSLVKATQIATESLLRSLGQDAVFAELERTHIKRWIRFRIEEGVTNSTIQRNLNQLKAIASHLEVEHGVNNIVQHFGRHTVPGDAKQKSERYRPAIKQIAQAVESFKDSPELMLIIHLGLRVSELVNISRIDVHLDEDVPHVKIQRKIGRRLKTDSSVRDIPLVGEALRSVEALLNSSSEDSLGLLPRFYDKANGADNFSAYAKKRFRRLDKRLTAHCFRHGLKDLLREANVDSTLNDAILGHASPNVGSSYGNGYSLLLKSNALKKAYSLLNQ